MPYVSIFERKGIEKGYQEGYQQGMQQGYQQGDQQGYQRGVKEGYQQGIQQGKQIAMLEIAKSLLDVLDEETIAKKTGLTLEEIMRIKKEVRNDN